MVVCRTVSGELDGSVVLGQRGQSRHVRQCDLVSGDYSAAYPMRGHLRNTCNRLVVCVLFGFSGLVLPRNNMSGTLPSALSGLTSLQ